jgi:hypothetical protein
MSTPEPQPAAETPAAPATAAAVSATVPGASTPAAVPTRGSRTLVLTLGVLAVLALLLNGLLW